LYDSVLENKIVESDEQKPGIIMDYDADGYRLTTYSGWASLLAMTMLRMEYENGSSHNASLCEGHSPDVYLAAGGQTVSN
jgi:hypothetical protein